MVMSMTGYGRKNMQIEGSDITVEVRTVNHRFLDISLKLPRHLIMLEDKLKKIIKSYFKRGRIELSLSIDGEGFIEKTLETDWDLLNQYIKQMHEAQNRYQLSGDIPTSILASIPDIFLIRENEKQPDYLVEQIESCTKEACEEAQQMRKQEGEFLVKDLNKHLNAVENIITKLMEQRPIVVQEYRHRIMQRVEEQLNEVSAVDHARVQQEIILLAEKGDITEEITRLNGHLKHFNQTLENRVSIGRKLDFIAQEMYREANTIGSKSTDVGISEWTVTLKSEIEKIKEQVQNLE
ncbi:YicC/YloC family endoribonuclease [Oceanobacillus halophilus]|uniref:YicC family protein n=1 Tax=Oceanobacillus halophilus TaxID=930130 RepID=A0A495ABM5_9BACI|nr:YicC/YloC family endoribonuclease [Oceanobacillus halophilus]RKQ37427.1 YicC family protein [Oceanobacillus halophilus]